jgi:hypothetical protein
MGLTKKTSKLTHNLVAYGERQTYICAVEKLEGSIRKIHKLTQQRVWYKSSWNVS